MINRILLSQVINANYLGFGLEGFTVLSVAQFLIPEQWITFMNTTFRAIHNLRNSYSFISKVVCDFQYTDI